MAAGLGRTKTSVNSKILKKQTKQMLQYKQTNELRFDVLSAVNAAALSRLLLWVLTAAERICAPRAVLSGDKVSPSFPHICVLIKSPLPIVEFFTIRFLTTPQNCHRAPCLLYHFHNAIQGLSQRESEA